MSREPAEVFVAVHVDRPQDKSVRVSLDGDDANGVWIARSQISSFHLNGKTTQGKDRHGNTVRLPLAHMTLAEWLAKKEGLI